MTEEDVSVNDAVAFLQKTSDVTGVSVFDHLTSLVAKILTDRPGEAVDLLETSYLVKRTTTIPDKDDSKPTTAIAQDALDTQRAQDFLKLLRSICLLPVCANVIACREPELAVDLKTGAPLEVEPPNAYECDDFVGDGYLFEALGVGIGAEEMHSVALMAKCLGEDPELGVASIRFFGKFFAIGGDYYVFETQLKTREEETEHADGVPIEIASGANAHVYFVCQWPGGAFTRLPDVKPEHICVARQMRRFLTGDLEADVCACPLFPGKEAAYLRAQIARIGCATVLSPAGHFAVNEEGNLEKSEEAPDCTIDQLKELSSWCHLSPHLKKQGRCVLHVRKAPEGEEEGFELTEEEQEEGPEMLTPVDQDTPLNHGQPWTILTSSSVPNLHHQVVGLRSNSWPGAFSVAKGTHYANVYIGWGFKDAPYSPPPPPSIMNEYDTTSLKERTDLPVKPEDPSEPEAQE